MVSWTFVHLEAYCMYSSMSRKFWKTYSWKSLNHPTIKEKSKIMENRNYIPKTKRPKWCRFKNKEKIPQYKCLKSNCQFFAYTDASEKDYLLFNKVYKEDEK